MAIIGNNDTVSTGIETAMQWEHQINATDTLVMPANQIITEFHYRSSTTTASASETVQLGIYDITSGANNAPLLATASVTFDGTAAGVYSNTGLSIDMSAHSGKTVAIARAKSSTNSQRGYQAGTGEPESASTATTLADPFIQNDLTGRRWYGIWAVTATAGPTIDSSPSSISPTESFSFTVSGPATAPTTGNTTGNFTGLTGIAPDSVTGSDPYTITWTLPRTTAKLFDATGYVFDITIDAESVSSSAIPYAPPTGSDYITAGTIDTGAQVYTDYTGGTFVSTDQLVWTNDYVDGDTPGVEFTDDLNFVVTRPPVTSTVYRIAAAGTVDVENTMSFSLSDDGTVSAVIKPMISNVISSVVN